MLRTCCANSYHGDLDEASAGVERLQQLAMACHRLAQRLARLDGSEQTRLRLRIK